MVCAARRRLVVKARDGGGKLYATTATLLWTAFDGVADDVEHELGCESIGTVLNDSAVE
jgi:hypothetical protein